MKSLAMSTESLVISLWTCRRQLFNLSLLIVDHSMSIVLMPKMYFLKLVEVGIGVVKERRTVLLQKKTYEALIIGCLAHLGRDGFNVESFNGALEEWKTPGVGCHFLHLALHGTSSNRAGAEENNVEICKMPLYSFLPLASETTCVLAHKLMFS